MKLTTWMMRTSLLAALLALAGCFLDADDGTTGQTGEHAVSTSATALSVTVDAVTIDSEAVVDFTVRNQDGVRFVGLPASTAAFTLARLNGDGSDWVSYVQTDDSDAPGTKQGTTDSSGTFVDNGDGTYRYTFKKTVAEWSESYLPAATHRLGVQIFSSTGTVPNANGIYTWQPSTGATSGIPARAIVQTESCNDCHGSLSAHGGRRTDTRMCVTCHNESSTDGTSGNTLSFRVMFHKMHNGSKSPQFTKAAIPYTITSRGTEEDFSTLVFPQDIRNCAKCHDAADAGTPDAGNWQTRPSRAVCGSCHDDVNFDTDSDGVPNAWNIAHPGGIQTDDTQCYGCHQADGVAGSVAEKHVTLGEISRDYRFEILAITDTTDDPAISAGEFVRVRFRVVNPNNGDTPYIINSSSGQTTDPAFTSSSLTLRAGWSSPEYTNEGQTPSGTPLTLSYSPLSLTLSASNAIRQVDGSYIASFTTAIPASITSGTGLVSLEGRAAEDLNEDGDTSDTTDRIPIESAIQHFSIGGATIVERREVVELERCARCHDIVDPKNHSAGRSGDPRYCALCHNPERTNSSGSSTDIKRVIHGLHATAKHQGESFRETAYRSSMANLRFPGLLNNCENCHLPDTYTLADDRPIVQGGIVHGSTAASPGGSTSDNHWRGADLTIRTDDLKITPIASVCSACHDSSLAAAHMELNGADFAVVTSVLEGLSPPVETCPICHGPGRMADVKLVHGIQQ